MFRRLISEVSGPHAQPRHKSKALGRFAHAQPDILAGARIEPAESDARRPRPFSPPEESRRSSSEPSFGPSDLTRTPGIRLFRPTKQEIRLVDRKGEPVSRVAAWGAGHRLPPIPWRHSRHNPYPSEPRRVRICRTAAANG